MSFFQRSAFVFFLLLASYAKVYATWSVIIIDPKTHEIGIAGASCTYNCYGIGGIVPGKGAVIVQAMSNKQAKLKALEMLEAGATPQQVLEILMNPAFDPQRQQYAIVCLNAMDASATFTGDSTHTYRGALTAHGVSVQGNTLTHENELTVILEAVRQGQKEGLSIDQLLMRALEAGAQGGGDKRCGDQKATSAFLTVARPDDKPSRPYLNLSVFGQRPGSWNAVELLRRRYDQWKQKSERR